MRSRIFGLFLPSLFIAIALLPGCNDGKVYICFGQHVDFYHSYRGDTPDESGFGHDIDVINATLDMMEAYPQIKMSWEFDSCRPLNSVCRPMRRSSSIGSRPGWRRRTTCASRAGTGAW